MKPRASGSGRAAVGRRLLHLAGTVLCVGIAALAGAAPPDDPGEREAPRLRCWQEGQLLFEQVGWRTLSAPASKDVVLGPESDEGRKLLLIQVGRATCLLED